MKSEEQKRKCSIFLDTSALLAGLNSPTGASGLIISIFKSGEISAYVSGRVIEEAERAIEHKFPRLATPLLDFVLSKPEIIKEISPNVMRHARAIVDSEDTEILAGALAAKSKYLITLDKRFIKKAEKQKECTLLTPGDFLGIYRKK